MQPFSTIEEARDYFSRNCLQKPHEVVTPILENAALILDNLERIINDERLFATSLPIFNHLAFIGTDGFENPTLGAYALWWSMCQDFSRDKQGNPIWIICGSPLSGNHCCESFDRDGNTIKAELKGRLLDVARSFIGINQMASVKKIPRGAYTIEEAIEVLKK